MCGISGIYSLRPGASDLEAPLRRMIASQRHRGPDDAGLLLAEGLALGHNRLSIIDIAGGAQPMANEDGTVWIVYNGEIFNYIEIRRDLEALGHGFHTQCDTEVILHIYEEYGPDGLEHLNGQFAFAIWDSRRSRLFLARDRFGIHPLHYAWQDGAFLFASEAKALFASGLVQPRLRGEVLDAVTQFWSPLPGDTAFEGVREIPPGHWMQVDAEGHRLHRYWDIPFRPAEAIDSPPLADMTEELGELLLESVRLRLRADVPVGCYLSGGLDSSGLSALVANNYNHHVRTYGLEFEHADFDEGQYQRQMVEQLGVEHQAVRVSNADIARHFRDAVWHGEKPMQRTAPTPMYLLARMVHSQDCKVVLTGEGADEVFGGYNIFRETKLRHWLARNPGSQMRTRLLGRLYPYIFKDPRLETQIREHFARGLERADDPFFSHLIRWDNTLRTRAFLLPERREAASPEALREQLRARLPEGFDAWQPLARAQYLESTLFMSQYLLCSQGDRMAMAHGLELRVPYLDHHLVERLSALPAHWKILGLNEKFLLKKIFDGVVPDTLRRRPKNPFRAPIAPSLLGPGAPEWIGEALGESAIADAGFFDAGKVGHLVRKLQKLERPGETDTMALVIVLSTQLLHSLYVRGEGLRNIDVEDEYMRRLRRIDRRQAA